MEEKELGDGARGDPVILENVPADRTAGVDVAVVEKEFAMAGSDCRRDGGGLSITEAKNVSDIETSLDRWMIQCLDDVNALLGLRQSVTQALREGWMEIARARYAMGPNRLSYPVFSLRPCSASTCVALSGDLHDEDSSFSDDAPRSDAGTEPVNVSFKLLKVNGHNLHSSQNIDRPSQPASVSQLRRRTTYRTSGGNGSLDNSLDDLVLLDDSDSDDETALASSKENRQQQDPLYMFGALVSPDVRSAQRSFLKAIDLVIEMANTQTSVVHAHGKVMKLKDLLVQYQDNEPLLC